MCSDVVGSNKITEPCEFPTVIVSNESLPSRELLLRLTKGDIAAPHPGCAGEVLVRHEACDLLSRHQIPDDGRLRSVITYYQPSLSEVTRSVDSQNLNLFRVAGESPLNCKGVVVCTNNRVALGVKQHGSRRRTRLHVSWRSVWFHRREVLLGFCYSSSGR